jgi:hypothetical protein
MMSSLGDKQRLEVSHLKSEMLGHEKGRAFGPAFEDKENEKE